MKKSWMYYMYNEKGIAEAADYIRESNPEMAAKIDHLNPSWLLRINLVDYYPDVWRALWDVAFKLGHQDKPPRSPYGIHVQH